MKNISRPMNTLMFKGNFSVGEMHSWLRNCLPEVPDRANSSSNDNILMFKNVLVGSFLVCKYSRCDAEFKSDNISTIAILKDFITKEATTKHIKLELSTSKAVIFDIDFLLHLVKFISDINEATVEHFYELLEPKLEDFNETIRNHKMLEALLELNVQNDDEYELLSDKHKNLLLNKQILEEKFKNDLSHLDRIVGILKDFLIDKTKFKGIQVKNKLEKVVEALNSCDDKESLLETICSTKGN